MNLTINVSPKVKKELTPEQQLQNAFMKMSPAKKWEFIYEMLMDHEERINALEPEVEPEPTPDPTPDPEQDPEPSTETKVLSFEHGHYENNDHIYTDYNLIMSDAIIMYLDHEVLDNNVLDSIVFNHDKFVFFKWDVDNMYHFGLKNENDKMVEGDVTVTLNIDSKTYSASTRVILRNYNYNNENDHNENDRI